MVSCLDVSGLSAQSAHDSLLFARINGYRVEQGLVPLVWDSCMYLAAKHQADYQCAMARVTHQQTPYSKFKNWNANPFTRISHFCPQLSQHYMAAENCGPSTAGYRNQLDMEMAVDRHLTGWILSTGHRKNLLFNAGNEKGGRPPMAAVAISCGCEGDTNSVTCYATFVVRERQFTDQ